MLRLGRGVLAQFVPSSSSASPVSQLHRLLSAAAPRIPPNPSFAVEDYLVGTCGLTPAQALKASAKLAHLKSPSKPDAVLAFLAGLGLSGAEIAAVVARDPLFLCAGVEKTLASNVVGLTGLGLSSPEIARLVSVAPAGFRRRSIVSRLQYYLPLLGSCDNVFRVFKSFSHYYSLDKVVNPNVAFLRECGLDACGIASLCLAAPWILITKPESIRATAVRAEALGAPRGSRMFRHALKVVAHLSEDKIATQVEYLKNTFRWSDAEVRIAVSKLPITLTRSKDIMKSVSEFLLSEAGLEPAYIAHRPALLSYSLEGRLRPRYYVVKFLKEIGLLKRDRDYYSTLMISEKAFVDKFICPHKEAAPYLAEDYAAACRGEVPSRFNFT